MGKMYANDGWPKQLKLFKAKGARTPRTMHSSEYTQPSHIGTKFAYLTHTTVKQPITSHSPSDKPQ